MQSYASIAITTALALFLAPASSSAYIQTRSLKGDPVRWSSSTVHLDLAGNPGNTNGFAPGDFFNSVVHGLERWKTASGGTFDFDYWQGTDPANYPPSSGFNGVNSIFFASNTRVGVPNVMAPNVLGLTQVWYNVNNGKILETDVALNDIDFDFTTHPTDTSGYGSGDPDKKETNRGRPKVFIENVITHELGHALGLAHSAGLQSTMLFMESPEQAHLGCDEQIAIHALYPGAEDASLRGSLSGQVLSESGAPVFGAHVLAISADRGVVLATALTDPTGHYQIEALEPGTYYVTAEPYFAGPMALPPYYAGINDLLCANKTWSRSFLTQDAASTASRAEANDDGALEPIRVSAGADTNAETLVAQCKPLVASQGAEDPGKNSITVGPDSPTFARVERLSGADTAYDLVVSGPVTGSEVSIHALAYTLYSPIKVELSLFADGDANDGEAIPAQALAPVFQGDSGYIDYDASLEIKNLEPGSYRLYLHSDALQPTDFPAGPVAVGTIPEVVITVSSHSMATTAATTVASPSPSALDPPLASSLPVNGRCEVKDQFVPYTSPPGNPPRSSAPPGSNVVGSAGFCAGVISLEKQTQGRAERTMPDRVAWLLPWMLMLMLPMGLRGLLAAFKLGER